MSNSKFLSEVGWKDVAAKNGVKDNGLLKKLGDIKRVGDDKHDDALKLLDEALKLAGCGARGCQGQGRGGQGRQSQG
jgi:hypothetical protein